MDPNKIKNARAALGESQMAFARRFGVNQATIHRWEQRGPRFRGPAKIVFERLLQEVVEEARECR